jgi:hypothetical protein
VCTTELVVMLLVINNTWRRTELWATVDGVGLRLRAPLQPRREHWWPRHLVNDVRVVRADVGGVGSTLYELDVLVAGSVAAKLFTGHPPARLADLGAQLQRAMPAGGCDASVVTAAVR